MTVNSSDSLDFLQMGFFSRQRTQKLLMRSDSHGERMQKVYALDYCAASFVTEGEVKYCIAKLFSGDVKFATALDY